MEINQKLAEEIMNAKSAPKHVSRKTMTQTELGIVITVAITGFLLQISTVWFYHKAPDVPAVEPTSQEVSTNSGVLTTII